MKYCRNCGKQLDDAVTFCPYCGTQLQAVQPTVVSDGDADVQQNKGIAWLSYLGPLLLVPMLARKTSAYCKFHVKQGATLLAVSIAYSIVSEITKAIIRSFTATRVWGVTVGYNGVYHLFYWLFFAGSIFLTVLAIIGIVNAATGSKNKLPLIGEIPWIETLMDKIYDSMNSKPPVNPQ